MSSFRHKLFKFCFFALLQHHCLLFLCSITRLNYICFAFMLPEVLIYTYKQSYSEIITVDVPVIN